MKDDNKVKSKSTRNRNFKTKANNNKPVDERNPKIKSKDHVSDSTFRPGNDFSWWSKYPDLVRDSCSIPLNWFPGTKLIPSNLLSDSAPYSPVATLKIGIQNTYGCEDSSTGPINMMARNLYLAMHRNYRGLSAYQSSDLAMVLIATVELFSYVATLERIYGVINKYKINNRATPYADLDAMGVSPLLADDIRLHLADFRYELNSLILKAQNVLFPKDMSIIANKLALFGYIYKDHDSDKAQHIVFSLDWVGQYDATYWSGSSVKFTRYTLGSTYNAPLALLRQLIDALVEDDDVVRIYSDLCAFMGPEAFVTLQSVPTDYTVEAVYSEEILHKIHNISTLGAAVLENPNTNVWSYSTSNNYLFYWEHDNPVTPIASLTTPRITQYNNVVITKASAMNGMAPSQWYFERPIDPSDPEYNGMLIPTHDGEMIFGASVQNSPSILDTYHREATPETILEGCLFKVGIERTDWNGRFNYVVNKVATVALEFVTGMNVIDVVGGNVVSAPQVFQYVPYAENVITTISDLQMYIALLYGGVRLSQIDWAPFIYQTRGDTTVGYPSYFSFDNNPSYGSFTVLGDLDNCRLVYNNDIEKVHETACYSAWATKFAFIGQ